MRQERLDPLARGWERLPAMGQARVGAAAAGVAGRLFVCGGLNPVRRSAECFDPETGLWEALPEMGRGRGWPAAAGLLDRLYVCGGLDDAGAGRENLACAEAWSAATGRWTRLPSMAERRMRAAAAAVEGRVLVKQQHI